LEDDGTPRELSVRLYFTAPAALSTGDASWEVALHFLEPGSALDTPESSFAQQVVDLPARSDDTTLDVTSTASFALQRPAGPGVLLVRLVVNNALAAGSLFHLSGLELVAAQESPR
jgi:hypothetical protein